MKNRTTAEAGLQRDKHALALFFPLCDRGTQADEGCGKLSRRCCAVCGSAR